MKSKAAGARASRLLLLSLAANVIVAAMLILRRTSVYSMTAESLDRQRADVEATLERTLAIVATLEAKAGAPATDLVSTLRKSVRPCPRPAAAPRVAASACSAAVAAAAGAPWLLIAIPTFPRAAPVAGVAPPAGMLSRTLASLEAELPSDPADPLFGRIEVLVLSNSAQHPDFDAARDAYGPAAREKAPGRAGAALWTFAANDRSSYEPKFRKTAGATHTRDVVHLLGLVAAKKWAYLMMMEDDFELCPNGLRALHHFVAKAHAYNPAWAVLRVSYGLNGLLLQRQDLGGLTQFLRDKVDTQPVDLLAYKYFRLQRDAGAGKGALYAFRHNLLRHRGDVSTFAGRAARYNIPCFGLLYDWLQDDERFDAKACPADDITPCTVVEGGLGVGTGPGEAAGKGGVHDTRLVDWDVPADAMCPGHYEICGAGAEPAEHCRVRKPG